MIKNFLLTFLLACTFTSCSLDDDSNRNISFKSLPIKEAVVPETFEFGKSYTVNVTYDLPDGCHSFYNLYYAYEGTSRIVAITALVDSTNNCTQAIIEKEFEFVVKVSQVEDYTFKFWKGEDNSGNDIFEEIIVPVTN